MPSYIYRSILFPLGTTRTSRISPEHLSPNGNTNTRPGKNQQPKDDNGDT